MIGNKEMAFLHITHPTAESVHLQTVMMMSPRQRSAFSLKSQLEKTLKGWNYVWQKTIMQAK